MKTYIKIFLVIGVVSGRNLSQRGASATEEEKVVFEEGFNPGQSNSQSGSGSGYHGDGLNQGESGSGYNGGNQGGSGSGYNGGNQGDTGSGYNGGNQGGSNNGYNGGNQGGSNNGYNGGNQGDSGSGYNGGNQNNNMNSGFHPGKGGGSFNPHIPDFVPDESITNSGGGSFFNPGRDNGVHPGSNRPDSRPDPSGRPDSQVNSNTGFNPGNLGFAGFRTPIVFADDEEEEEVQSVGEEESEEGPGVILLQSSPAGYYPLLQPVPAGLVAATTLPAYLPGGDKQQYARTPFLQTPAGLLGVQNLPGGLVFAAGEDAAYVPGTNKQQYLRGGRRPIQPQYVPLIQASNPLTGSSVGAESLPGPIVFAPAEPAASSPYVPGTNKQQYLRGRQTKPFNEPEYRPLIAVAAPGSAAPAQTLPEGLVFAAYVPGGNKQPYLRDPLPRPTIAAPPSQDERFVLLTPRRETRPAPVARQPFLRASQQEAFFPGVSSRPSFPPGFPPRQFSTYSQQQTADQGYQGQQGQQGPKNVLYFFK